MSPFSRDSTANMASHFFEGSELFPSGISLWSLHFRLLIVGVGVKWRLNEGKLPE